MKIEAHVDLAKTEESMKRLSADARSYLDMYVKDQEESICDTCKADPEALKKWEAEKTKIKVIGEGVDFITRTIPAFMCILEMARDVDSPKKARELRESAEKLAETLMPKPKALREADAIIELLKELFEIGDDEEKPATETKKEEPKNAEKTEEPKIKVVRMSGNISDLPKELQELFKKFG